MTDYDPTHEDVGSAAYFEDESGAVQDRWFKDEEVTFPYSFARNNAIFKSTRRRWLSKASNKEKHERALAESARPVEGEYRVVSDPNAPGMVNYDYVPPPLDKAAMRERDERMARNRDNLRGGLL